MEIRQNQLSGADFEKIKNLYPKLYKLKVGENPIKSLDVFKCFVRIFLIFFFIVELFKFFPPNFNINFIFYYLFYFNFEIKINLNSNSISKSKSITKAKSLSLSLS